MVISFFCFGFGMYLFMSVALGYECVIIDRDWDLQNKI